MLQVMDCVYELVFHRSCSQRGERGLELLIFEVLPEKQCIHSAFIFSTTRELEESQNILVKNPNEC